MIKVYALDHSGRGIAKIDNKIVFIKNALPDEIVEIKINKDKKKYIEADVLKYIEKSDKRVKSPCPYFNICGGCDIMHISYDDQLLFKQDKIENIVKKYLDDNIKINKIVKCDNICNYRNKTTFQVKKEIGFYKNNTYDIVPIDNCLISNNIINNSINYLKQLDLSKINQIICRSCNDKLMIIIDSKTKNIDIKPIESISDSIYLKINNEYKLVYGDKYIKQTLDNYTFSISPDSFFQVNIDTCLKLYNKIKDYVGENKNVLDLYCGTGSISIFISKNNNILGIELNEQAILDANINKELNNINNIEFLCGDAGKIIKNINFNPDIIVVDPPRGGLNKETIDEIIKINPKELIYVSCDPMTLVRDLKLLNSNFNIIELTPFDMFPNTKHVESLVLLKNNKV